MSHLRQQIRDNIVTTLTGLATTGSSVYKTRVYDIERQKLPAICIYNKSESSDYVTIGYPRRQERTSDFAVEIYASANSNLDDAVDGIALEVEEALSVDTTRNSLAKDTMIIGFEAEFIGEGEKPVAVGRLTVQVLYTTLENDIETAA